MKTLNLKNALLVVFNMLFLAACISDDEFDLPNTTIQKPNIKGTIVSIGAVLGNYNQTEKTITFQDTDNIMEGYVISSDEGGNFFKKLILQDQPENPTAGISIQVDRTPLFTKYELGRKVYVKLDGLSVGLLNGVIQLGRLEGNTIVRIPPSDINNHIIKSDEVARIVPKPISICHLSNTLENLFIRLDDVQFNKKEVLGDHQKTFAAESNDQFNGERLLESCTQDGSGGSVILSTSTFSDFKSVLLPMNSGTLDGILVRNFFDTFYTIIINAPSDLNFTEALRCDMEELDCSTVDTPGTVNLFSDDFESQTNKELITGNGWTNYVQLGTKGWEAYTSQGSNPSQGISARMTSSNSGDDCAVAWLITPAINLTTNKGVSISFETSNSFADGSDLEILFSTNWEGTQSTITDANWGLLPAAYVVQDSDLFSRWFPSGNVNLSCGTGTIHIAFRYRGSDEIDFDGTYELDNISIDAMP